MEKLSPGRGDIDDLADGTDRTVHRVEVIVRPAIAEDAWQVIQAAVGCQRRDADAVVPSGGKQHAVRPFARGQRVSDGRGEQRAGVLIDQCVERAGQRIGPRQIAVSVVAGIDDVRRPRAARDRHARDECGPVRSEGGNRTEVEIEAAGVTRETAGPVRGDCAGRELGVGCHAALMIAGIRTARPPAQHHGHPRGMSIHFSCCAGTGWDRGYMRQRFVPGPHISGLDVGNHGVRAREAGVVEPRGANEVIGVHCADKRPLQMTRAGGQKEIARTKHFASRQGRGRRGEHESRNKKKADSRGPEVQMAHIPTTAGAVRGARPGCQTH